MNTSTLEGRERAPAIDRSRMQDDQLFSGNDEVSGRYPLWIPEDIAEPETWTLASFDDLLPHAID